MKIVLGVHHFPPHYLSGAVLRAYRLARWLDQAGHKVTVVCVEDVEDRSQDLGLVVHQDVYKGIRVERLSFNRNAWPEPLRWEYDHPAVYDYFEQLLSAEQPDLVHLISGYLLGIAPLRAAEDLGIPRVVTLTDFWFLCPTIQLLRADGELCWGPEPAECTYCSLRSWVPFHWLQLHIPALTRPLPSYLKQELLIPQRLQERLEIFAERRETLMDTLNRTQGLMSITRFLADMYIKHGVSPELFRVLSYHEPDLNSISGDKDARPIEGKAGSAIRFAYLGSVYEHKGVEVLVAAFRKLQVRDRARLTLYGPVYPESLATRLKQLAGDAPVYFAGPYEHERLPQIMAETDVVIVPSLWHENAPRTIVEAHMYGNPVIGSDVGGIAELIQDGTNGLLFERDDPSSLATQMKKIIDNPSLIQQFRANIPELAVGAVENERVFAVYQAALPESQAVAP
jgi:glycosyltransferase involved in cell wall biosynthesis